MKQINVPGNTPEFFSVLGLAAITSESVAVWRKRILFKSIGYTKCGKNVRVSRTALEQWLATRTTVPTDLKGGC